MEMASFFQAVRESGIATSVRESTLAYPIIMGLHLASIALFGGMILMTNLRLLGLALQDSTVAEVLGGLRIYKRIGFVVMVTCGLLLGAAKADQYYLNPYFQVKMALLVLVGLHALVFRSSVYANPEKAAPGAAKAAACISLVLWLGILSAGRWIAYYEMPRETAQSADVKR